MVSLTQRALYVCLFVPQVTIELPDAEGDNTTKSSYFNKAKNRFSFVLGVIDMMIVVHIMSARPHIMPYYYTIKLFPMIMYRWHSYQKKHWHYFLLDFCYFANTAVLLYTWVFPHVPELFVICFALSNGPVLTAVVLFRNSLVFHSIDKMTSLHIHVGPTLVLYCIRWLPEGEMKRQYNVCLNEACTLNFIWSWLLPSLCFLGHQVLYGIIIQGFCRKRIEANPASKTVYKHLVRKHSGLIWNAIHICGHKNRVMAFGFFYTLMASILLLPTALWYRYQLAHDIFIAVGLLAAIQNGSNFYFEVFASDDIQGAESGRDKVVIRPSRSFMERVKKNTDALAGESFDEYCETERYDDEEGGSACAAGVEEGSKAKRYYVKTVNNLSSDSSEGGRLTFNGGHGRGPITGDGAATAKK